MSYTMDENCVTGIISGESPTHYKVAVDSEGECKGCGMSSVCSSKTIELEKDTLSDHYKVGEKVQLEYKKVIQTSFIVYILPILFFFLGIGITKLILHSSYELLLFIDAIIATGISLVIVNFINKHYSNSTYKVNVKHLNI